MGPLKNLSYLEQRVYHAVQEIYAEYSRPIGVRSLSSFLGYRDVEKLHETLTSLEHKGHLVSPAPGIWTPTENSESPVVQRKIIREQVDILEQALKTKEPVELKQFVARWCEDMEIHIT